MNNSTMRRFLAALMVMAGLFAANAIATAQPYTYTCIIVNGVKVIIIDTQGTASGSTGSGTFNPIVPPPPQGPINAVYAVANINVTANDPVNGAVTTRLAPGPQPISTIVSNSPDSRFPATGTLAFNAQVTLSSRPGVPPYTSATPLSLVSTNLTSIPPFAGETFKLASDVDFTDATGAVALTLKAGSSVTF